MRKIIPPSKAAALVVALQEITRAHDLDHQRLSHGLELMLNGNCWYSKMVESWMCESHSNPGKFYAVDVLNDLCVCPDCIHRGAYCKHLVACWLAWRVAAILAIAESFRGTPENLDWLTPVPA